jgi:carbon-monoxide dehydrogenase medium subunit
MLSEFDLLVPENLSEAIQMMSEKAPDAAPVAGGTNLIVDLRSGKHTPAYLVNIEGLAELQGITLIDKKFKIGAGTKINELLSSKLIQDHAPILSRAAKTFANPLIRNRATVGGNLVDASPASDTVPPLLVLDAEIELISKEVTRLIPLVDFFLHVRKTLIKPDEILTSVSFPVPSKSARYSYYKLGLRKADAISVISAAVLTDVDADGNCRLARIALGSVAPKPIRVLEAEETLMKNKASGELIAKAAAIAAKVATPISDVRATARYRTKMVETLVRRLLTETMLSK